MITRTLGWGAIVISVIALLIAGAMRLGDMTQNPPPSDAFGIRYLQHPWVALLHIVPGVLFVALAPLQFIARIRQQRIGVHRWLGQVLATCAMITGVFALVVSARFPEFGGTSIQAATLFYGAIFLFALAKSIRHIRKKEVSRHREWMIRVFALALGAASARVFVGLFMALSDYSFEQVFGTSFWLGFGANLLIAEVWIRQTRDIVPSAAGDLRR